jgi:hypothetical protein
VVAVDRRDDGPGAVDDTEPPVVAADVKWSFDDVT